MVDGEDRTTDEEAAHTGPDTGVLIGDTTPDIVDRTGSPTSTDRTKEEARTPVSDWDGVDGEDLTTDDEAAHTGPDTGVLIGDTTPDIVDRTGIHTSTERTKEEARTPA